MKFFISCMRACMKLLSHIQLFAIPWTVAYQAPPSMEFSRQEYWNGLPFPSPSIVYMNLIIVKISLQY